MNCYSVCHLPFQAVVVLENIPGLERDLYTRCTHANQISEVLFVDGRGRTESTRIILPVCLTLGLLRLPILICATPDPGAIV
jgi:hypothetical protein